MKRLHGIVSELPQVNKVVTPVAKPEVDVIFEFKRNECMGPVYGSNAVYVPQAPVKEKKMNVKRFILGCTISTFLVFVAVFGIIHAIGGKPSLDDNIQYIKVSVESGDTLWSLVREANPEYKGDIRNLVYVASKHNHGAELMANSVVEIPVVEVK